MTLVGNHGNGCNGDYNGKTDTVSDFIIYCNLFGEFDNFDQLLRWSLSGLVALTTRRELVRSAGTSLTLLML